jgi:pyrroline-5-carboxylate reductase
VIISVKPKDVQAVLNDITGKIGKGKLVISIAAAISTKYIEKKLGSSLPVIRFMPNTPALIRSGVLAFCRGRKATPRNVKAALKIFSSLGRTIEVKESEMDTVTAVSGSGPAYLFYFAEALRDAAIKNGLKKAAAEVLAYETILGAAKMILSSDEAPEILRERVTSPGGTTLEAIRVFEKSCMKNIIKNAVKAAKGRSKELTK